MALLYRKKFAEWVKISATSKQMISFYENHNGDQKVNDVHGAMEHIRLKESKNGHLLFAKNINR